MMLTGLEKKYLNKGIEENKLEIARLMFSDNLSLETVSKYCPGISIDKLKQIQQEVLNSKS